LKFLKTRILKLKTILITNDDGFESRGLEVLIEALSPLAEIITVAPSMEKSACAHSITITKPLKLIELKDNFYKLDDGTPSDCIYVALDSLFKNRKKPDLIISGINVGSNMGEDITYSGTVAGAMEGTLHGVPSIAISQILNGQDPDDLDYSLAKKTIFTVAEKILNNKFPLNNRELLNINVPNFSDKQEIKITYAGYRIYENNTHIYKSPRGETLYWLGVHSLAWNRRKVKDEYSIFISDFEATEKGFVSMTPILLDLTAYESMNNLNQWLK
jgi:5'-nucleotidase